MLGLIIKDLLYIKNLWKNMLIIFIGSLLLSMSLDNYLFVICIIPLSLITMGINTFQADEFFNTDIYTLSYPLSRKNIVKSKYYFTGILFGGAILIGLVLFCIFKLINNSIDYDILGYLLVFVALGVMIDFIFYPIIYRYGCEKSSFILTTIVIFIMAIGSIIRLILINYNISINIDFNNIINVLSNYGVYLLVILLILVTGLSYFISVKILEKLDF